MDVTETLELSMAVHLDLDREGHEIKMILRKNINGISLIA